MFINNFFNSFGMFFLLHWLKRKPLLIRPRNYIFPERFSYIRTKKKKIINIPNNLDIRSNSLFILILYLRFSWSQLLKHVHVILLRLFVTIHINSIVKNTRIEKITVIKNIVYENLMTGISGQTGELLLPQMICFEF